ncbi:protein unifoliata-like, partial [Trifolium pratense]
MSEEPVVQREKEAVGSGGGSTWEVAVVEERRKRQQIRRRRMKMKGNLDHGENEEGEEEDEDNNSGGCGGERQREHPFIVTEPGEVARGKKNGLDYLFHLYEQCREFLIQVQAIAKERGEKCPTK